MRKRLVRYLSGTICLLFAAGIGMAAKYFPVSAENGVAEATISYMPKADKSAAIGTAENPFTILEIVPNKSMGMIGYMIPGCEPVDMEALAADRDLNPDFKIDMIDSGLFSGEGDNYAYSFVDKLPEGAVVTDDIYNYNTAYGKWCTFDNIKTPGYSEYGYYEYVGVGNGSFAVSEDAVPVFTYQAGGAYQWEAVGYYYPVTEGGIYNRITEADGSYSFAKVDSGAFAYQEIKEYSDADVVQDLTTHYWTMRTDAVYYRYLYNGYQNLDVLVSECFENASSYGGFVSQVITVTPDELTDGNLGIIKDSDMIVITAQDYGVKYWIKHNKEHAELTEAQKGTTTFTGANGNDLSWNATLAIVDKMASDSPAAMILQFNAMCGTGEYNMEKLYIMLMQYGAKSFQTTFLADTENMKSQEVTVDGKTFVTGAFRNPSDTQKGYVTKWDNSTFMTKLGVSAMHESAFPQGQSEVFGTILTYNGDMSMLRAYTDPQKISEIKTQGNDYYKPGSNSELFDYYQENFGNRPSALSMCQATRYVLMNATGGAGYKQTLHILEVQPCNEFIYGNYGWQLYYSNLFPWFTGDLTEDLTVTTMTSYQLIGDISDLNSEYDLILFGDKQDGSNGLYGYNDTNMNLGDWENGVKKGLVYTSLGDLVTKNSSAFTFKTTAKSSLGNDAYQLGARYSGNDLTKKKYEEIKDYLLAGKPVIMAAKLYSNNKINTNLVDASSYMCRLGNMLYQGDAQSNTLFKEGSYVDSSGYNWLKSVLAKETCDIGFAENGYPTVYEAVTGDGYAYVKNNGGKVQKTIPVSGVIQSEQYNQTKDAEGKPMLRYEFTLEGNTTATYGVRLFIDRNGDGIFNNSIKESKELLAAGKTEIVTDSEEVGALNIVDVTENGEIAVLDGTLLAGHRYVITRSVPLQERGILPWKLEVYNKNNDSIRCSMKNYTAIEPAATEKVQINVLQMNLMPNMKDNGDTYVNFADKTTETGAKFDAYLNAVSDFNVQISYMENKDWYKEYSQDGSYAKKTGATKADLIQKWESYLEDVDMLVLGFRDMAAFTNDEVFYEGFMDYVNSGKSVILSHDLVNDATFSYREPNMITGYDATVRTISGQRKKYYVADSNEYRYDSTAFLGQSVNLVPVIDMWDGKGKDISGIYSSQMEDNTKASEFMDNSIRLLETYATKQDKIDRVTTQEIKPGDDWPYSALTQWIRIANKGQVTSYPYALDDTIQVSSTHAQNFQLDLEQENGGDVTVWYNLTDSLDSSVNPDRGTNTGLYSSKPGDARNNYYIYTKGNITYTGLGHSKDTLTDDEVKLFVNTMISSYRVIPEKPYIKVKNEDASEHKGVYTMYIMLTGAEDENSSLSVNFSAVEESLTEAANRTYYLQYQDEDGEPLQNQISTLATDGTSMLQLEESEKRYRISANGNYSFEVPYREVLENGQAVYYLSLNMEYLGDNEVLETRKVTKVILYAMPLFSLH